MGTRDCEALQPPIDNMSPMTQDWHRRIESWLEATIETDCTEPPAKRARHRLDESIAHEYARHTPPPTDAASMEQPKTPVRKRGIEQVARDVDTDVLGPDDTPKPRHRLKMPTPRKRAPPSPKKTRALLHGLEKPVYINVIPAVLADALKALPADIVPLFRRVSAANERHMIIPHELREEVAQFSEARPWYFRPPDADPTELARARGTFQALRTIVRDAATTQKYQRSESAWNSLVHTPILRLIFASDPDAIEDTKQPSVRFELVTSATIAGNSIPFLKGPADGAREPACSVSLDSLMLSSEEGSGAGSDAPSNISISKMRSSSAKVDYVLALDMPKDTPLARKVSDLIHRDAPALPHVNQTAYLALMDSPIAVAIETKTETAVDDPLVQLGIWTAAWYQRMYDLRTSLVGPGPKPRLVSVPIIQVVGHAWQVYFVQDAGTSINVYGPLSLGSTETIVSLYSLLSSLEAVRDWVQDVFRSGMETWLMCDVRGQQEMATEAGGPADVQQHVRT